MVQMTRRADSVPCRAAIPEHAGPVGAGKPRYRRPPFAEGEMGGGASEVTHAEDSGGLAPQAPERPGGGACDRQRALDGAGMPAAHSAWRADHSVHFFRLPRLVDELTRYHALQNRASLLRQIAKAEL